MAAYMIQSIDSVDVSQDVNATQNEQFHWSLTQLSKQFSVDAIKNCNGRTNIFI